MVRPFPERNLHMEWLNQITTRLGIVLHDFNNIASAKQPDLKKAAQQLKDLEILVSLAKTEVRKLTAPKK